jgi:NAD(P)-dependent dehydrogenase (short-subunit alcohol dehydrogenase family)
MGIVFDREQWAIVLGGSTGFGMATAQKLARHGMNIALIHRDRKSSMPDIERSFDAIRGTGVRLLTVNGDALCAEMRRSFLDAVKEASAPGGNVRILLHSIAYGNLKPLVPASPSAGARWDRARGHMAAALGVTEDKLIRSLQPLFGEEESDTFHLLELASKRDPEPCLEEEDFERTIHAMATSLAVWTQDVFHRGLFAESARVVGLTSEGNEVAIPSYAAVSAAKGALEAVCRSIAVELAPYGIRANIVQPGVTDTPALAKIPGSRHMKAAARLRNPFGRLTTPADVADFICLLCTEEAGWVNGAVIRVDGGERVGA